MPSCPRIGFQKAGRGVGASRAEITPGGASDRAGRGGSGGAQVRSEAVQAAQAAQVAGEGDQGPFGRRSGQAAQAEGAEPEGRFDDPEDGQRRFAAATCSARARLWWRRGGPCARPTAPRWPVRRGRLSFPDPAPAVRAARAPWRPARARHWRRPRRASPPPARPLRSRSHRSMSTSATRPASAAMAARLGTSCSLSLGASLTRWPTIKRLSTSTAEEAEGNSGGWWTGEHACAFPWRSCR